MKHIIAISLLAGLALICPAKKITPPKAVPQPEPEEEPTLIDLVSEEKQSMARDMLDRVEKIKLVATLRVDSADFFSNYLLSADAGELLDRTAMPMELSDIAPEVVYRTQNGKELFWAQPAGGYLTLMTCKMLDNGSALPAEPMGDAYSDGGGDSNFPFVMQDGSTIYFANNGDNSIGGYDIFMTRRSPDGDVLQPQNIGMPFNSPFNDFMMVIDEGRNLGWWASDREQIPGKLTIYVFEPSQMRENYDSDLENIEDIALLKDDAVRPADNLADRIAAVSKNEIVVSNDDLMPDEFGQLTNPQARAAARGIMAFLDECDKTRSRLTVLRQRYAGGDKSVADEIKKIEEEQLKWPTELKRLYYKVMSLENK